MEQKTLTPEEQQKVDDFVVELKKVCTNFKLDLVPALHFSERCVKRAREAELAYCL